METLIATPLFHAYAIAAAVLTLLMLGLAFATGTVRGFIEKQFVNPEDEIINRGKRLAPDGHLTSRYKRAHQNALENVLPFLVIGLLLALLAPQSALGRGLIWVFLGARVIHSLAYVSGKQPFRTLSFFIGWGALVAMTGMVLHSLL